MKHTLKYTFSIVLATIFFYSRSVEIGEINFIIEVPALQEPIEVIAAEPSISLPITLLIPSIDLHAPIVHAGLDSDGLMSVPADNATVSWWKYGARPGQQGSAVIAGHYKVEDGGRGVFFDLQNVKIGDTIEVVDDTYTTQQFMVTHIHVYSLEEFSVKEVYANDDGKRLNLITCTGEYEASSNDYTHRLIVRAEKV